MRVVGKQGVPVVLANHNERVIGHLNEVFFQETTRTDADDDRRGRQIRFDEKSPVDFARIVREKLLNSLSDFPGEHQNHYTYSGAGTELLQFGAGRTRVDTTLAGFNATQSLLRCQVTGNCNPMDLFIVLFSTQITDVSNQAALHDIRFRTSPN